MPKMRSMSSIPCSPASAISVRAERPELALHLAAQAAQRRGGDDALHRSADPDREVVVRSADRGADRGDDVAVVDQLDAGAGLADLGDQVVVPRALEHDRGHVAHAAPEGVCDRLEVLADRPPEVDPALGDRPDGHLLHVHAGQRREAAGVGRREDRERPRAPACHRRAVPDRVACQIERPARRRRARGPPTTGAPRRRGRSRVVRRRRHGRARRPWHWMPRGRPPARRPGPGTGRRRARTARSPRSAPCSGTARRPPGRPAARSRRRRGRARVQGTAAWRAVARSRIRSMTAISARSGSPASITGHPIFSARPIR